MLSENARAHLRQRLEDHEGLRLSPYRCSEGKLTIGIGRNLEDRGITLHEAEVMLSTDIHIAETDARTLPGFTKCGEARKTVLVEMCFQMGITRVRKFKRMLNALYAQDYDTAADEMLDSKWARQTPGRAGRLANIMRSGKYEW